MEILGSSDSEGKKVVVIASSSSSMITLPSEIKEKELEWKKGIPAGFKFAPSMEECIYYLQKKVRTGRTDIDGVIRDIDLYKYEPEDLKALAFESESHYYFTPLQKRYTNGTKTKRTTVHGFWKGTQTTKLINNRDNKPIATRTPSCYFSPKSAGKNAQKTQWLMTEYRLINQDNSDTMLGNWALCVIYYKTKRGDDVEHTRRGRNKSSNTDMKFKAVGSSSRNSPVGSTFEHTSTVSSETGNSCQTPQPAQSLNINRHSRSMQQQYSTCYDQPLLFHPSYGTSFPTSHALLPIQRSANHNDTPNPNSSGFNGSVIDDNIVGDQLLAGIQIYSSMFNELHSIMHDECPDPLLPQKTDDFIQNHSPSMNPYVSAITGAYPPSFNSSAEISISKASTWLERKNM